MLSSFFELKICNKNEFDPGSE